ncbi:dTDP-4-dehydrorhamnose reductase [Desulfovibrio ferrophilus]|uniref:dTDP-4-dehydrorhamnose reductase n=1 Tax=Desulfovibrio ferrophilus TaxID=241368 RepID=A0A2Z6AVF0_9BACT|nr:dTDP-4-dehydrorhamnose reductase [Desulfovibrio ferrophilus]BBD07165.1 dTDP-4-dehydrorhamnose reductase [Desulfovibrio ferrophilus]
MSGTKALILGGETGLLGMSLAATFEDAGWEVITTPRPSDDAWNPAALGELLDRHAPDVVFNTWAYTQVDLAEDESDQARRVNAVLPEILGRLASDRSFKLVHYSTDFVFGGKAETPRKEEEKPTPECVYGRTKFEGERALLALDLPDLLIIRTAWLFGPGKKNFVRTMLDLCRRNNCVSVVHDQVGSPTYTPDLAKYSLDLIRADAKGLYHVANAGRASWCELASEALRSAGVSCEVTAIASSEYPQKAKRPGFSVLDTEKFTETTGVTPRSWVQAVRDYVYRETTQED